MTDLTERQRDILSKLRAIEWLRGLPVIMTRGATDEGLLDLTLAEDLGLDSLDRISFELEIEEEFGITVEDGVIAELLTVRAVVAQIEMEMR